MKNSQIASLYQYRIKSFHSNYKQERRQRSPCLTPLLTLNSFVGAPFTRTNVLNEKRKVLIQALHLLGKLICSSIESKKKLQLSD